MPLILYVEDSHEIREGFSEILELEGFTVNRATDGRDALTQITAGVRPNLILLDLHMPVMDGWTFLRTLRSMVLAPPPVIVLSALLPGDIHDPALLEGCDLRPKTGDLGELLSLVRRRCGLGGQDSPRRH